MAARFFIAGGVDNNWGTAGNWSATSGGVASGVAPTAADDVHLDGNSPNCTVNASARVALTLDFTGYTQTITMSQQITVSGSVTLAAAMTIAGAGDLFVNAAATLTSNGKAWPNNLSLNATGTVTYTLTDIWVINGLVTIGGTTGALTVNGFQFTCNGGFTQAGTVSVVGGTTALVIAATGTITGPTSTGATRLPITINAGGGTITFATGNWRYNTGTLTYVSGTVVASSTDLIAVVGTTFDTGGAAMTWRSVTLGGSTSTFTFSSSLHTGDLLPQSTTTTSMVLNGPAADLRVSGNLTITNTTTGNYSGTLRSVVMAGTGTVSWASVTAGRWSVPLTFDAAAGTVTVTGVFPLDLGKLVYLSGTVITSATWTTGGGVTPTFPPASKVYAGTDRGDGTLGTLHASNIATAAGGGVNLTPSILLSGNTVDDVVGTHTEPVVTFPPASSVYAGVNRGDGVVGTLHASTIAAAAGAGENLTPAILRIGHTVDDVVGAQTDPVITYPPASKVYAGSNRGDGVIGTLHASNIATAAGSGSNLAAGDLRSGVTVDDVAGSLVPTGGTVTGGAYTFID